MNTERSCKTLYVNIKGVHKSFLKDNQPLKVLDDIDISIEKGSFVSIVGPSGCGKSTLLNLIAGLDQPDEGAVYVNEEKVTKPGPDRVVVFQSDGLFPWLTVLENVTYGLRLNGMKQKEAEEKARETLQMVHLSNYIQSYPHQLSGGMKQRVAIARALVMEPDILLMDEPFSALDEQTRMVLHHELLNIWKQTKVTIFFVTHNIREAVQLSEQVIVFATRPGRLKQVFSVPTTKDGIMPDSVTMHIETKILAVLKSEIEKVLKEEMGSDYSIETNSVHRDYSGDLGSNI